MYSNAAVRHRVVDEAMRPIRTNTAFRSDGLRQSDYVHGDMAGAFRLGNYRILFTLEQNGMRIFSVRHSSEAYR
jgi:hypothetical protein